MRHSDVRLGQRVQRHAGASSLVQDRNLPGLKPRRIGIVVTLPLRHCGDSGYFCTIQWEGTTLSEQVAVHRLEPLPLLQQPVALGGEWTAQPDTFVVKKISA